jgi:hypothetical protein
MIIECLKSDQVPDDKLEAVSKIHLFSSFIIHRRFQSKYNFTMYFEQVLLFVGNLCIYSNEARKLLIDGDLISILSTLLLNVHTYLDLLLWNLHILCCSDFPISTTREVLIPVSKVLMGLDTIAKEESISAGTEALKIFICFLAEGHDEVIRQTTAEGHKKI